VAKKHELEAQVAALRADDEAAAFYADPANRIPVGPPRKRRKSEVVSVRMDRVMVALIRRYAGPDVTVSAWVRRVVQRQLRELRARERPTGLIPGSARAGEPKALPSSLRTGPWPTQTFTCPHLSISGVAGASCGTCGSLPAVA
jgi:hypothetical protein